MKRPLVLALLLLISIVAAAAQASKEQRSSPGVLPAIAQAPFQAREQKNPYEGRRDAILAGEKLFRQHCTECHGEDARGIGRAADLRSPEVQNATAGALEWFLRNGNLPAGMPSWSGLPPERRWQIVTYLKTLR